MLTGVGPSPVPREGENLLMPPWTPPGEPVPKEGDLSAKRKGTAAIFSDSQLRV